MNCSNILNTYFLLLSVRRVCVAALFAFCLLLPGGGLYAEPWADSSEILESGLELAIIPFNTELGSREDLVILRVDPQEVTLDLLMSSELGIGPLTPEAWAERYDLFAVINASMYLGNANTSTGYMRHGDFVNNGNVAGRFGAFFVAGPKDAATAGGGPHPPAAILDREADDWQELLPLYDTVAQNFRIIDGSGKLLWGAGDKRHSIAALGEDESGFIYFIHTPGMISVPEFVRLLSGLPIKLTRLMYVEGGRPAALHVRTSKLTQTWRGRYAEFLQDDAGTTPLPNVIVVRAKNASGAN